MEGGGYRAWQRSERSVCGRGKKDRGVRRRRESLLLLSGSRERSLLQIHVNSHDVNINVYHSSMHVSLLMI